MALITEVSIQNFKCYRRKQTFSLTQSNFFIGPNNAGKSAILKAIHCFFDDNEYSSDEINKTELRAKSAGYNKSIVGIKFDFSFITTKTLKKKLINKYGTELIIYKNFTYREITNTIIVDFTINSKSYSYESLPTDIGDLFSKISLSYIHPQEAEELFEKAQEKLKERLLANWGRGATLSTELDELQKHWTKLRKKANTYLSKGLTQNLQNIWPGCETKIDLPEKISDIIGISEIMFKAASDLPDVSITSQGTGARSTILYQTHYILDSDKTLHRGFYYPIWLIEEPESFLHADIIFKLGQLLCSDLWLNNIQMLISTHSPLLLSTSKINPERVSWISIINHALKASKRASDWFDDEIKEIGIEMGDPNFDIYFKTPNSGQLIIIEDEKAITEKKLKEAGINVSNRLKGSSSVLRYFDVLRTININNGRRVYFLVDNDKGFKEFETSLSNGKLVATTSTGFMKYEFSNDVYIVLFPEGYAMEELFDEHDRILTECASKIFTEDFTQPTKESVPAYLTRAHAAIRSKKCKGIAEAKQTIRNQQDVKDFFWGLVESNGLVINEKIAEEINSLII